MNIDNIAIILPKLQAAISDLEYGEVTLKVFGNERPMLLEVKKSEQVAVEEKVKTK